MVEINLMNGMAFRSKMSFGEVMAMLELSCGVKGSEFLHFRLVDGLRAAVKKDAVIAVNEYQTDDEAPV